MGQLHKSEYKPSCSLSSSGLKSTTCSINSQSSLMNEPTVQANVKTICFVVQVSVCICYFQLDILLYLFQTQQPIFMCNNSYRECPDNFCMSSANIFASWLRMVVSLGRINLILRYLNRICSDGASPVVHGRLSSSIHAENRCRNPFWVGSIVGFSSPSFKYDAIMSALHLRFSPSDSCSAWVGVVESFFLHSETWLARLLSLGRNRFIIQTSFQLIDRGMKRNEN